MKFNVSLCLTLFLLAILLPFKSFTEAKSEFTSFTSKTKSNLNKKSTVKNLIKTQRSKHRTTSELQHLLTLKRSSALEKLLATRTLRDDDDIPDPYVIFRIAFASHRKPDTSCPYPLSLAESYIPGLSGDMNVGKGGEYIYLCIGKKRISDFTGEESFVNEIHLNTNQEDCGKLLLIKSILKSGFFSSDIYEPLPWTQQKEKALVQY
jgi:hypothetical protein